MIKRYYATKDNTVTNSYNETLSTRGSGSNMGQSDILEVFSIYGQVSSSTSGLESEATRAILQFDSSKILSDKNNGMIASGSSFYLKLFNARHGQTLPRDYTLEVTNLVQSWQEGLGLDMENYTDLTYDVRGSNWVKRQGGNIKEITKVTFESNTKTDYGAGAGTKWVKIYGDTSVYGAIWFNDGAGDSAPDEEVKIEVDIASAANKEAVATAFRTAVNNNANFTANVIDNVVYVTASNAGAAQASPTKEGSWAANILSLEVWYAGDSSWRTTGATSGSFITPVSFPVGDENLEVDITTMVNCWLDGTFDNNGLMVKLSSSLESSSRSYYTKKFFGRGSHHWFERPVIEARWDSSKLDDRGQFYLSSSLVSAEDNLNTIYLYNYARGRLRNIPGYKDASTTLMVSLYNDNDGVPGSDALRLISTTEHVTSDNPYVVTGGYVETGIYSASFAYTGDSSTSDVRDVWFTGGPAIRDATATSTQFKTGSITVKRFESSTQTETEKYVLSVANKNSDDYFDQTHRIRLYARQKKWSPNIYTTATSIPDSLLFTSASYQIHRIMDDKVVIAYNTGSVSATRLSYDTSGNYFDLDTSMLEPNYMYGLRVSIYDPDTLTYEEQSFLYKFRVIKNES